MAMTRRNLAFALAGLGIAVALLLAAGHAWGRVEIAPGLVVTKSWSGAYALVDEAGRVHVPGVEGWIVTPRYVLGSSREGQYFSLDRACHELKYFDSMQNFGRWLDRVGEQYRYSDEEGTADIFLDRRVPRFARIAASEAAVGYCG